MFYVSLLFLTLTGFCLHFEPSKLLTGADVTSTFRNSLCDDQPVIERKSRNWHKKVISYSLFNTDGSDAQFLWYLNGMVQNAKDAQLYYPEWIVRVYITGLSLEDEERLSKHSNVELVRCFPNSPLNTSKSRRMLTRFLVIDDPKVALSLVRDADSRLNPRELFAVNEWIASGLNFHAMRDHEQHNVPILGGMFGMKRGAFGNETVASIMRTALLEHPVTIPDFPGEDQAFLAVYIWPRVKTLCLVHDEDPVRCTSYGSQECRKFPLGTRDGSFFVGAPFDTNTNSSSSTYSCSVSCSQ